ncbi:DUF2268 domain-containing putative Zn-dependent protease [Lysinibacillus sp. FJAT-14745]|uniref:DUF2268 domain-containing putative Zn-dependent protease n=1 Tax=Lysinibacillus sp. FJAT-14745 TaxID=1704289 RepID=UPI000A40AB35|nr:DUF2268 domain-containing putative Zn-dependent protease [Lysinibacillus sp. FJAT-14745]
MKNYLKIVVAFVLIISILTLTSCTQTEKSINKRTVLDENQDIENIVTSFEHPQTKQKFKIVNAYKLYNNYIDEVKSNQELSQLEIYNEEVIKPIYSDCFENGEYLHMAYPVLNEEPDSLTENQKLSEKIDREETEKIIKEALIKSSDLIASENETTVCVLPVTNTKASMLTVGAGKIIVLYNISYTENDLRSGIAHEYHHSVWTEKYLRKDIPRTILDNLIFEGKAVMFDKLVYPDIYYYPIYTTYSKDDWSKIALDLEKTDINRSYEILMGGNDLPSFYGYGVGYQLVKSYLDLNPTLTSEEWTP